MTEREKFEAWLKPQFNNERDFEVLIRKCGTRYANNTTEFQWDAWQARAAQDESMQFAGYWFQHEDTGAIHTVDEWQVKNGFEEANPRLINMGKVYIDCRSSDMPEGPKE